MSDNKRAERVYLAPTKPRANQLDPAAVNPARFGWVEIRPNLIKERVLLMGDLSVKSDWYNVVTQEMHDNPESLALFQKCRAKLRRWLPYVPRVRGIQDNRWYFRRSLRHSDGILSWIRDGGALAQWGTGNIEYAIDEKAESKSM